MEEERSNAESGQTRTSKKGDSFPNAPSAEQGYHYRAHIFTSRRRKRRERKQNAGTWNRERGTIYLRKERKRGGLKKDDDA